MSRLVQECFYELQTVVLDLLYREPLPGGALELLGSVERYSGLVEVRLPGLEPNEILY